MVVIISDLYSGGAMFECGPQIGYEKKVEVEVHISLVSVDK